MSGIITKIVLTGGPSAGKTSSLNEVKVYYEKQGYYVVLVNESPVDIINAGITLSNAGKIPFQKAIIDLQIQKERIFIEAATKLHNKNVLVFLDRGIVDHFTYLSGKEQEFMQTDLKIRKDSLYERYDAVFHLKSLAYRFPELYKNNKYRLESPDEARHLDDLIAIAWKNHPHYYQIDCEQTCEEKLKNLINAINIYLNNSENISLVQNI